MGVDAQMFIRTMNAPDARELRQLSADLVEAVGAEWFWLSRDENRHALALIDVYEQDGDPIHPNQGEQFIEINVRNRYYGPGYERGNWPVLSAIREWVIRRLPDSEVWYGGDSAGLLAAPLSDAAMRDLWRHWATHGHRPYTGAFNRSSSEDGVRVPVCHFCGDRPMDRYGWGSGGAFAAIRCDGCGRDEETRDGGKTWARREKGAA